MLHTLNRILARTVILGVAIGLGATALWAKNPIPTSTPFVEHFARLDPNLWYISDGWSNGPQQNCTWSKSALAIDKSGGLDLKYIPPGKAGDKALCAEVQTKKWFRYGTFEARMKSAPGSGLNAAFFSFTGAIHKQPHDEIDFERLTRAPNLVWLNRYVSGNDFGDGQYYHFAPASDDDYHNYAFIWAPDSLKWYVDGVLVRKETAHVPTHPMKIYFSHWGSDTLKNWMGPFKQPTAPVVMNVTRFAYTPLGQRCVFPESVTCNLP